MEAGIDLVGEAGANTAVTRTYPVTVSDGVLDIAFSASTDNAKVSAIEVRQAGLVLSPEKIDFAPTDLGLSAGPVSLTVQNSSPNSVTVTGVAVSGANPGDFSVADVFPLLIPAGNSTALDVSFTPTAAGVRGASLSVMTQEGVPTSPAEVVLSGTGVDPSVSPTADFTPRSLDFGGVQTGGLSSVQSVRLSNGGGASLDVTSVSVTGTDPSQFIYLGPAAFSVAPGSFVDLEVQFAPTVQSAASASLTIVSTASSSPDTVGLAGDGLAPAPFATVRINAGGPQVTDSSNQVWAADQYFSGGKTYAAGNSIAGTTDDALYQTERYGNPFSYAIPVPNATYDVVLHFAEIYWSSPGSRVFSVSLEGNPVEAGIDLVGEAGANTAVTRTYPVTVSDGVLDIAFSASIDNAKVSAIEVIDHASETGDPFLHVVIDAPRYVIDFDGTGGESIDLIGHQSHTHELGHSLVSYLWEEGSTVLGTAADITSTFALGQHDVSLTIGDDNDPPRELTDSQLIDVFPLNAVGGFLARYYHEDGTTAVSLLDSLPSEPGFTEVLLSGSVNGQASKIGGSPFTAETAVELEGVFIAPAGGSYEFFLTGVSVYRLFIDGAPVSSPVSLTAGTHDIRMVVAVADVTELPVTIDASVDGGPHTAVGDLSLTHDESLIPPFINSMPTGGSGGDSIDIYGLGFFPEDQVVVHWGNTLLQGTQISVHQGEIHFTAPAEEGTIDVQVETPNGLSNIRQYVYATGTSAVSFSTSNIAYPSAPTRAAWGPDGRLYVGTITGMIYAYSLDDDYNVTAVQEISAISGLSNPNILGLAFNPWEAPSVRLYVAHGLLFANGGACFTGVSPYSGEVTVLEGPDFDAPQHLITGLPVSNHDHSINGMEFDNYGDMYVAIGGNTNAGVPACEIGDLPESPFSAAVIKAQIAKPGFNGQVHYFETGTGTQNDDQVFGGIVDPAPGLDLQVYAAGFRNSFDLVWSMRGIGYLLDNGPNYGFGPASTGPDTQGPDPNGDDEVNILGADRYYGHPNRNRGRTDYRQNIFRHSLDAAPIEGEYTAPIALLPPSSDGIEEYHSLAFGGQLRGDILVQHWNGEVNRIKLTADGRAADSLSTVIGGPNGLDIVEGPAGALLGANYSGNMVTVSIPDDPPSALMKATDITPWRAPAAGGAEFIIGGENFGTLVDTHVHIGGEETVVTSVSPTRIRGVIQAASAPTAALVDVEVVSNGEISVIPGAFRYLLADGEGTGAWHSDAPMPVALGEVASGIINGVLYLVGEGSSETLSYDIASNTWRSDLAVRPYVGDHHAAEVIDGKLYLFGGIGGGSDGRVQIYDPGTDSWSLGTDMPYAGGSCSTGIIDGLVYIAGGIVANSTVNDAAVYNPETDTWAPIAPMRIGRNHAAGASDGSRLWIFGGRGLGSGDGNVVAEGFDDVQVYDPATDTWEWSGDPASTLAVLPQRRGGTGTAAYFRGEFYVIGGETTPGDHGQVAGNVYNRVDVYNPLTNSWRLETVIPTARHGIYPIAYDGKIYVAGGGTQAGYSASTVLEVFER